MRKTKNDTSNLQFGVTLSEVLLTATEAAAELGIDTRQVQKLAQQGRLTKSNLPKEPGARGKAPVGYTLTSINDEKERRARGEVRQPSTPPPVQLTAAAPKMLSSFGPLQNLITPELAARIIDRLAPDPAPIEYADDAYLTVKEAAQVKRMPQKWILEQCLKGYLPSELTSHKQRRILRRDLRKLESHG
jgi:hypothetical protein